MKIDLPALRAALATIRAHDELLVESMVDLDANGYGGAATEIEDVVAAIAHVVDDDYRSPETPGGS